MASWALIYSARISFERVCLRWASLVRTLNQSRSSLRGLQYSTRPVDRIRLESTLCVSNTKIGEHRTSKKSSPQLLVTLVKERHYEVADRVRAELLHAGVEIPLDYIYEEAAKSVLQRPHPQHHVAAFANWFVLLPDAQHSRPRKFHEIRDILFSSPSNNMPLIIQFGIIAASKGYANIVEKDIVPVLARIADLAVNTQFLSDFQAAVTHYQNRVRGNVRTGSNHAAEGILDHDFNPGTATEALLVEEDVTTGEYMLYDKDSPRKLCWP